MLDRTIRVQLETKAEEVWAGCYYKVHPIDGGEYLAKRGGGLHCITKVLRRSEEYAIPNITNETVPQYDFLHLGASSFVALMCGADT
ncbi:MAG: hypothetical protein AAF628_35165, partial [Planctomycetota bacterium]